uniref:Methylosome subunit pICln n=1 Tax=Erpetoichthys calabaricus TaxID=27687 RepID=A0A8C4RDX6_ERPCA
MVLLKNVSPPSEGIHYQQAETMDVLDGKGLCLGTLYVEHLYVMVNCKLNDLQSTMSEKTNDDEGEEEEDDSDPISKIRFVPSDKTALELLFSAMCECQGDEYDVEKAQQGHGEEDLHLNSVWHKQCDFRLATLPYRPDWWIAAQMVLLSPQRTSGALTDQSSHWKTRTCEALSTTRNGQLFSFVKKIKMNLLNF